MFELEKFGRVNNYRICWEKFVNLWLIILNFTQHQVKLYRSLGYVEFGINGDAFMPEE